MTKANILALGAAVGLMIGGGFVLRHELLVEQGFDRLDHQSLAMQRGQPIATFPPWVALDASPYIVMADALYLARQMQLPLRADDRRRRLTRAKDEIEAVLAQRPQWGEAWVISCIINMESGGVSDARISEAYRRSYESAPFLPKVAEWRIQYGTASWDRLSPLTRARMLDEAMTFGRLNGASRVRLFDIVRGTAVYRPMMVRWHAMRTATPAW